MTENRTTIAATSTPPGQGGIAIVRISGPEAEGILERCFRPAQRGKSEYASPEAGERAKAPRQGFESHRLMYGHVLDATGAPLDEVMAVLMRAPSSYTREDVAEIHCHGGRVSASAVLNRVLGLGARMAEPGEFTRRAFLNGRIDLARAEAVMQLIGATGEAAARASLRQLEGGVSGFVKRECDRLVDVMALLEASTDFPDEVEEEAAGAQVARDLEDVIAELRGHCDARGARLLREGASIVLAGRPNVGKSSLMNALLNQDRAIVTAIPGTTRDVLTERVSIGGVLAELSDTAGQRLTDDPIERIGVDRARRAMDAADVVLIVLDASQPLDEEDARLVRAADARAIVCLNKQDLEGRLSIADISALTAQRVLELSAASGQGIPELVSEIAARIAVTEESDGQLMAQRHIELAQQAAGCLERAVEAIRQGMPLDTAAIDIRECLEHLTAITGENATESVIDRVFSTFCVGK